MSSLRSQLGHLIAKRGLDDLAVSLTQIAFSLTGKTTTTVATGTARAEFALETSEELRLFLPEVTERPVIERFTADVTKSDVVWDIGANVGLYGILAASKNAGVVAVEPHPTNIKRLKENSQRNGLDLTVVDVALGASSGKVTMPSGSGEAGENFGTDDTWGRQEDSITVERRPAADIISDGISAPDIVKIDVEGAELGVITGLLPDHLPRLIYCEVHGFAHDRGGEEVEEVLSECGYTVGRIYEDLQEDNYTLRAEYSTVD